ncbi:MAG: hypothetical protein P8188_16970 [Gemmatimonadota bacterium]|jgi:hypothetical protein
MIRARPPIPSLLPTLVTLTLLGAAACGDSAGGVGPEPEPELVVPVLVFSGSTEQSGGAGAFVIYDLEVSNRSQYEVSLFAPHSEVPACGLNSGSRTWVEIYDATGDRISGYCALRSPERLESFTFTLPSGPDQPEAAYIELWDRLLDRRVRSNDVALR